MNNVPPYFSHGYRFGNICHTQFRLGHSLHSYLSKVNLVPSAECTCGAQSENIEHFLLHFPLYAAPKTQLLYSIRYIIALGVNPNLLIDLVSNVSLIQH